MRWSSLFTPTLRDAPGDAEAVSHQLLVRGGFIRQLHAGHYTYLPLGYRVRSKVIKIIQQEMDAIGGQEIQVPTMHPASVWQESGRWESMGEVMFRLEDRHGAPNALGVTAEEIFATVATELTSYKQLPQMWYQINTKFRDEARPKSGLLRVREFTMKDAYSFDLDEAGLDAAFDNQHGATSRSSRDSGSSHSGRSVVGEHGRHRQRRVHGASRRGRGRRGRLPDRGLRSEYRESDLSAPHCRRRPRPRRSGAVRDPGIRTIAALEEHASADRQIKTMVFMVDDQITLALVRGDHQLNEQKLADITQANTVRPASAEEAKAALGAMPGSLGAVGVSDMPVLADQMLADRRDMTTGANEDDWHYRGVDIARDIKVEQWADLREVTAGEPCPKCGTALDIVSTIEAGHIFKLGRKYAETFGALVLDADGKQQPLIMGSYGIGVDRAIATIIETHHDDNGIIWPLSVAPFEVVITIVQVKDEASVAAANTLYEDCWRPA